MKELVVSHPFTTETVLTDEDSFLILACDGVIFAFFFSFFFQSIMIFYFLYFFMNLFFKKNPQCSRKLKVWDVLTDQAAVDLIKEIDDPKKASELLLKRSLELGSTDNISVMVIRFFDSSQDEKKFV